MSDLLTWFFVSFALNLVFIPALFLLIIFVGKPLFAFLGAKLMGKTILLVARKDRRLDFITGKAEGGMIRTKKYGDFMVIPQTSYLTTSGVSCGLVFEPYGVTLSQDLIDATATLKEYDIQTYSEMEELVNPSANPKGLKIATIGKTEEDFEPKKFTDKERKLLLANGRVTKSIDSVTNFFKYNINPNTIRATINRSISEVLQQYHKTDYMKMAMFALMIMVGGAIAYVIVTSGAGAGAGGALQPVVESVADTAKVVGTTGTGIG